MNSNSTVANMGKLTISIHMCYGHNKTKRGDKVCIVDATFFTSIAKQQQRQNKETWIRVFLAQRL